jgi:hypothetical protein
MNNKTIKKNQMCSHFKETKCLLHKERSLWVTENDGEDVDGCLWAQHFIKPLTHSPVTGRELVAQ